MAGLILVVLWFVVWGIIRAKRECLDPKDFPNMFGSMAGYLGDEEGMEQFVQWWSHDGPRPRPPKSADERFEHLQETAEILRRDRA